MDRNVATVPSIKPIAVALRKESVDRNTEGVKPLSLKYGRSPQGERG